MGPGPVPARPIPPGGPSEPASDRVRRPSARKKRKNPGVGPLGEPSSMSESNAGRLMPRSGGPDDEAGAMTAAVPGADRGAG